MSRTIILADGNFADSDKALSMPATVVDFPEPVVPKIAECLVTNLLISISASIDSEPAICPTLTK